MAVQKWLTTAAGIKMPPIIYGTAWKKERTAELVEKAVLAGFRGIDTACQPKHYNEPMVGEALGRLKGQGIDREALFVQTKFTPLADQDPMQLPYRRDAPIEVQVAQSFETSKKNMQVDYVDSLVLHSPMASPELLMKAWGAMEKIQKSGAARQLGISNCYSAKVLQTLYADATVKPAVLQNRFYQETGYDVALRHFCDRHGVIYQSFWTLTANPHILDSPAVRSLAQTHQRTPAQIFFRYLTQAGAVPLTGTCSGRHMAEDLSIFDFKLNDEQCEAVRRLLI